MLRVNYIATKGQISGRVVHEQEIRKILKNKLELNIIGYIPLKINIKGLSFILRAFNKLMILPLKIMLKMDKSCLTHITSEDLAFLNNIIKFKKTVVTCHDLIPLVFEKDKSFFLKFNIKGLKKAARIITVSNYSKQDIIKHLSYPENKIDVVYNAVDHNLYYPKRSKEILKKYGISQENKIILYVGSEQKRQNFEFLIKGFSELKKSMPNITLVKAGKAQDEKSRKDIIKLINQLGLSGDIVFTEYVSNEDLARWYNAADVFVYPCLYAGFSIPPLEAMACGTPVITSNTTSLPEVIGDAGIMINPQDLNQLTESIKNILSDKLLWQSFSAKGLSRAKLFTWQRAAEKIFSIYQNVI